MAEQVPPSYFATGIESAVSTGGTTGRTGRQSQVGKSDERLPTFRLSGRLLNGTRPTLSMRWKGLAVTPHDLVLWTGYATVVVVAINLFRLRVIVRDGKLDKAAQWTLRTTGILPLFVCIAAAFVAFVILDQFPDLVFLMPVSVNVLIAIGVMWSTTRSLRAIRAQRERDSRSGHTAS